MKKTLKYFGLFLFMGALIVSCGKEDAAITEEPEPQQQDPQNPGEPQQPEDPQITIDIPGVEVNTAGQMLSFGAEIEEVDTKVTVASDGKVSWENGDLVKVSVGEQVAIYQYDGSTSKFALKDGETPVTLSGTAYLYYPADAYSSVGATATLTVGGATSRDTFGDKNPMGAVLPQDSADPISFKNLCSVLHVTVTGDRTMTSLVLANASANISGEASVSWSGTGSAAAPTVSISSAATSQTITKEVNLSTDVADFYFIVPAATLTNLTITANLAGEGLGSFKLSRTGSLTMERSTITGVSFFAGLFSGGAGTEANPYKIATTRDFMNIQKYCENGYNSGEVAASDFLAAYYQQTEDIDFEDKALTPIASESNKFTGSYDGENHSLSNFSVTVSSDGAGLWAYAQDASFANISISGATVNGGTTYNNIGVLVGDAQGATAIESVSVTGPTVVTGNESVGGLVGVFAGNLIKTCGNSGAITGQHFVGGIAGKLDANAAGNGKITESHNIGTITALEDTGKGLRDNTITAVGGIVGRLAGAATIEKCYNHGNVAATTDGMAGGIVGEMLSGTVDCCYAGHGDNKLQVRARYYSGGIVGIMRNTTSAVLNCASSAVVGAPDGYGMAGGIAGDVKGGAKLANCVALAAKVWSSDSSNARTGAIVGTIEGGQSTVHNCYSQVNNTTTVGWSSDGDKVNYNKTGNTTRGGVYAYFYSGIVKDCYYTAGGPGAGSKRNSTDCSVSGNFKQITNNAKNGTADDSFSNFANGQTGGTMRLKAALNKGRIGVSYNDVSLCEWVGKKDGSEQAYPSVLAALGANYYD